MIRSSIRSWPTTTTSSPGRTGTVAVAVHNDPSRRTVPRFAAWSQETTAARRPSKASNPVWAGKRGEPLGGSEEKRESGRQRRGSHDPHRHRPDAPGRHSETDRPGGVEPGGRQPPAGRRRLPDDLHRPQADRHGDEHERGPRVVAVGDAGHADPQEGQPADARHAEGRDGDLDEQQSRREGQGDDDDRGRVQVAQRTDHRRCACGNSPVGLRRARRRGAPSRRRGAAGSRRTWAA